MTQIIMIKDDFINENHNNQSRIMRDSILSFLSKFYIPILIFCSTVGNSFSQNKDLLAKADVFYDKKQYDKAIPLYEKAMKEVTKLKAIHAETFQKFAISCMKQKNFKKAIDNFDKALEAGQKYFDNAAKEQINSWKMDCELAIQNAPVREQLLKNPVKANIVNLGSKVNSKFDDYCPAVNADETFLLFTSRRNTTTGADTDPNDGLFYEDFYYCKKNKGVWDAARNIGQPVNTNRNEGACNISADGQQVYFYKCLADKKSDDVVCGDIYVAKLSGNNWSNPEMLPNINTAYWESHPSISADGNSLYFASDRPESFGGRDIYVSHKNHETGEWQEAEHLDSAINTPYDDAFPFIHSDGKTLYFSSKGHPGIGGYDIFVSQLQEDGKWSKPENIGYPINSDGDDVFFRVAASGNRAYMSSKRDKGLGGQDIYEVSPIKSDTGKKVKAPECVVVVKGMVKEAGSNRPLEASIVFENLDSKTIIQKFNSNSETGNYMLVVPAGATYGITVQKERYLFVSDNLNIPKANCEYREIIKDFILQKLDVGKSIVLKNTFFDFEKWDLLPQSVLELQRLTEIMKQNPSMKIEISGHTDNKGADELNKTLSQKRSETVLEFLIKEGIDRKRLTAKGYGKTLPIAPNTNPDGSDNPDGRAMNRRTEFKILEK